MLESNWKRLTDELAGWRVVEREDGWAVVRPEEILLDRLDYAQADVLREWIAQLHSIAVARAPIGPVQRPETAPSELARKRAHSNTV